MFYSENSWLRYHVLNKECYNEKHRKRGDAKRIKEG